MNDKEILAKCDLTLLDRTATQKDIEALIQDGINYGTASICIPPCYVKAAANYALGAIPICTVIGFPNGYNSIESKRHEAEEALENGADEIDAVINIGQLKAKNYEYILNEIKSLRETARKKILKIIIETCLLTEAEKIKMCELVIEGKADYIKTSTGFSKSGATEEDVKLLARYISDKAKIKASGGIKTLFDAEKFIHLGADRIGTSSIIRSIKDQKGE